VAQDKLLDQASAVLTLADGKVQVGGLVATHAGGSLAGSLTFDAAARPPTLQAQATISGARAGGPVFDLPLDIVAGTLDARVRLEAVGYAPAGLLASLGGQMSLNARDGMLSGLDVARMGPKLAEPDLLEALAGGSTPFQQLTLEGAIDHGGLAFTHAALAGPAGMVTATGSIDLTRALLALRLAIRPAVADAPEIGLRIAGPVAAPELVPELAGAVRWRAEHP